MTSPYILIVEDDTATTIGLRHLFGVHCGLAYRAVHTLASARAALADPPQIALIDIHLPDGNGLDFVKELKAASPETVVGACTADATGDLEKLAKAAGADHYFAKPLDVDKTISTLGITPVEPPPSSAGTVTTVSSVSITTVRPGTDAEKKGE